MQSTQDTIFDIARIQILTKRRNKIISKNILLFIRNSLLQKYTKAWKSFEFFIFPFMIQVFALCMSVQVCMRCTLSIILIVLLWFYRMISTLVSIWVKLVPVFCLVMLLN